MVNLDYMTAQHILAQQYVNLFVPSNALAIYHLAYPDAEVINKVPIYDERGQISDKAAKMLRATVNTLFRAAQQRVKLSLDAVIADELGDDGAEEGALQQEYLIPPGEEEPRSYDFETGHLRPDGRIKRRRR